MDLRWRLVKILGGLFAALIVVTLAVAFLSVRADMATEVRASTQLARVLVLLGRASQQGLGADAVRTQLEDELQGSPLRHLTLYLDDARQPIGNPENGLPAWLLPLLPAGPAAPVLSLGLGGLTLGLAPNPMSEWQERLGDVRDFSVILIAFSAAALGLTWLGTDRALRPVRDIERALARLGQEETGVRLPDFSLREFRRIAEAIARLDGLLAQAHAAERLLARRLIQVQEAEREALARELHDDMGQTLTALGATATYLARNAERLTASEVAACGQELGESLKTGRAQLRTLLHHLNPVAVDGLTLPRALRDLVVSWPARRSALAVQLDLADDLPPMSDTVALALFRVAQEALTNVVRHAEASGCTLRLASGADGVCLSVTDDGRGMPASMTPGAGLRGMRARVEWVSGTLDWSPRPGGGTVLTAVVPAAQVSDAPP